MGPEVAAGASAAGAGAGAGALSTEAALGLLLGGTAAQMAAARQQQQQQKRTLQRAFDKNDETVGDATQQVLAEGEKMTGASRMESMRAAADAAAARTMSDLSGAGADVIDTAGDKGRMSDAFGQRKAEVQAMEGDRLSRIAQEVGRARAPAEVSANEALARSALAERLGSSFRSNQARTQAAGLDAESVDLPWYGYAGQLASLVGGMGLASGAGAGTTAAANTGATNPALIESAVGTGGYGASSATPAAGMGYKTALANALVQMQQQRRQRPANTWSGR